MTINMYAMNTLKQWSTFPGKQIDKVISQMILTAKPLTTRSFSISLSVQAAVDSPDRGGWPKLSVVPIEGLASVNQALNEAQGEWERFVWTHFISVPLSPLIVVGDNEDILEWGIIVQRTAPRSDNWWHIVYGMVWELKYDQRTQQHICQ